MSTNNQSSDFFANLNTGVNLMSDNTFERESRENTLAFFALLNMGAPTGNESSVGDLEAETGWTEAAAFDEAIEYRRNARLTSRHPARRSLRRVDNFEAETGWTRKDAFEAAIEHRSDARLYGTRH